MADNLYVHFPFCRGRCSYCTLHSRAGTGKAERDAYVAALVRAIRVSCDMDPQRLGTAYFGGGTPALCDLAPVLGELCAEELTVELHPLDVNADLLKALVDGGVSRISMGVQSLDDGVLAHMGRGYTFAEAERAFMLVREHFENAGIDLIVGYPGETSALVPRHARLAKWGLRHCSVYALQNERGLKGAADDDTAMNRISTVAAFLKDIGLMRYEISNYAVPGFECRHNLAVWRGEDYVGIGEGAFGRVGLRRTRGLRSSGGAEPFVSKSEEVTREKDDVERRLFRLRTREGIDAKGRPEWSDALGRFVAEGTLVRSGDIYRLTERGTEVCDAILAELV